MCPVPPGRNPHVRPLGWLGSALHGPGRLAADRRAAGHWHFENGVLYTEGENGGWLATLRQYDDFVLSLEFRVPPGGNSGVFIRSPLEGDPAYTGMEIQILDDYAEQWQRPESLPVHGSIYDIQAPSERATREAGQWQKMVITARGPAIEVVLNGEKIIDTDMSYYPYKAEHAPRPDA